MINQCKERYKKNAKLIEECFENGTKEYDSAKGLLKMINNQINVIEKGDFSDPMKYDFYMNSLMALFKRLENKIKEKK